MRYLLIDRIETLRKNHSIVAIKNVSLSEDVFTDHFVGVPVLPGALIIEALAQAGTALLEVSSSFTKKAILAFVKQVKFRTIVRPGDQMIIEEFITESQDSIVELNCIVRVNEKVVADGQIVFSLREAEEFYPEKYRTAVELLYSVWLRTATIEE